MARMRATLVTIFLSAMTCAAFTTVAVPSPEYWRAEGWKTDFSNATVPLSQIISGGVERDGIPSIDSPKFENASQTTRYGDREPVIELIIGTQVRAYPLSIMTWHEIVNDTIAGRPVAVTYCPLCNASIVFERNLNGRTLEFGTTGKLRNSDLVMYDRQTQTWWQQFTGDAIIGALAGRHLKMVPSRVVAYSDFRKRHPSGEVLVPPKDSTRPYGRNPYVAYDSRMEPYGLFQGRLPDGINPMARVVVVRRDGAIIAVSLSHLRNKGGITSGDIKLAWIEGVASALDHGEIVKGREVGAVEAVEAATGQLLVHDVTFAFVLYAFHPDVPVLTKTGPVKLKARK